jgi:hypothetical protein
MNVSFFQFWTLPFFVAKQASWWQHPQMLFAGQHEQLWNKMVLLQMGRPSSHSSVCRPNQKDILSSLIEDVSGDFLLNLDPIRVSRQAGDVSCSLAVDKLGIIIIAVGNAGSQASTLGSWWHRLSGENPGEGRQGSVRLTGTKYQERLAELEMPSLADRIT